MYLVALERILEVFLGTLLLILGVFIPANFSIIDLNLNIYFLTLPISWQIPFAILIGMIFNKYSSITSVIIYLLIGLLILPVFNEGGSIGYLITPNIGYLLGLIPAVFIISSSSKETIYEYFISGVKGILIFHLIGICFLFIQKILIIRDISIIRFIIIYTIKPLPFHLLMNTSCSIIAAIFKKGLK
tara:strand:+ start:6441 stop:7001 length:561 start_codon:yes stop_codon:yes gene_type:complete